MSDEVYEGAIGIDLGESARCCFVCAAGMRICKIPLHQTKITIRQKDHQSLTRPRYYLLLRCQL